MSSTHVPTAVSTPLVTPISRTFLWLVGAAFLALAVYYFVGVDQGATSVFGNDTHIHEFVHDARHFLGFPCHWAGGGHLMEKRLILRGVLAGLVGGVLAFVFARIFAEPQIQKAIDYESGRDAAQKALDAAKGLPVEPDMPEIFSRTIQANLGIGVGVVLFGAAMGTLFAVAYIYCVGRTGAVRPRPLALLVALGGFLGLYLVPFLKYPANPPAIGHEDTIADRGTLYLVMVAVSVGFLALAVWFGQRLQARFGAWNATLLAGAAFVLAIGVVMLILPPLGHLAANRELYGNQSTETPLPLRGPDGKIVYPGFPADVLATFRLYSVGAQLILWAAIGLLFGPMAERLLTPASPARSAQELADA